MTYASLADIKTYLFGAKASETVTDDGLLIDLNSSAQSFFDAYTGRNLLSASYTETRNGNNLEAIATRNWPITAVASVTVDTIAVPVSTTAATYGYVFDDYQVYIRNYPCSFAFDVVGFYPGGSYPVDFFTGNPRNFRKGVQNVTIVYTAGLSSIPPDVKSCIIELVAYRYKAKGRVGVISHSTQSMVTDTFIIDDLPASVRSTMNRYKRVVIV